MELPCRSHQMGKLINSLSLASREWNSSGSRLMTTSLALLTPPATGAIATLALHGPEAWEVLEDLFTPTRAQPSRQEFFRDWRLQTSPGTFFLGRLGETNRGATDDVVVALTSAVPVPSFEIHCHGGLQVIALLEEAFLARGVEKNS